ncbi:MAG: RDD family protein [Myxococcota bacterium]
MRAPLDGVAWIETPEQLGFRVHLAGPVRRGFAWLLDVVLQALLLGVLAWALGGLGGLGQGLLFVALFFFTWLYFALFEVTMQGRSPGKRVLRLQVLSEDGLPVSARQALLRNLLRGADLLLLPAGGILPLGVLPMIFDRRMRRFGDMLAGTIVTAEPRDRPIRAFARPSAESLRGLPPILPLDRNDLEALDGFAARRHLGPHRRAELAAILAPVYARRLGRPAPREPSEFLLALWARGRRREEQTRGA